MNIEQAISLIRADLLKPAQEEDGLLRIAHRLGLEALVRLHTLRLKAEPSVTTVLPSETPEEEGR